MDKVKNYRGVYSMLFKTTAKYYSKTPLMRLSDYTAELAAGYEKFKDYPGFPGKFYMTMADALIGWFLHRFSGCANTDDLQNTLNLAWIVHKPYLEMENINEAAVNSVIDASNAVMQEATGNNIAAADMMRSAALKNMCAAVLLDIRDAYEEQEGNHGDNVNDAKAS